MVYLVQPFGYIIGQRPLFHPFKVLFQLSYITRAGQYSRNAFYAQRPAEAEYR
jgi:hypothetical protein